MKRENEYMIVEYNDRGDYTTGKRVFKEEAILSVLKTEMRTKELIERINIPDEFLPLATMYTWLKERMKEGKVEKGKDNEQFIVWKAI